MFPKRFRQVLYTSQAKGGVSTVDCDAILRKSEANNARDELTGFLIFLENGTFLQILEGPPVSVADALHRISQDTRHRAMAIIIDHMVDERDFSEWTMGFRALNSAEFSHVAG